MNESRQVVRHTARAEAFKDMPRHDFTNTLIPRSRRRLMARGAGNRSLRRERGLPELAHMEHRHQRSELRK